jgi:hypothetical protein
VTAIDLPSRYPATCDLSDDEMVERRNLTGR